MTMKERILKHLKEHKTITTWEAITNYGCTRISEYIRQLRNENYLIESIPTVSKNRYGEVSHYVTYKLRKESKHGKRISN